MLAFIYKIVIVSVAIFIFMSNISMELYIKTPFYQDNKYVPHLLEHCVLFSSEREELLSYFCDVDAYTAYGHTRFAFDLPLTLPKIVHKITQPVSRESFMFQKNIIVNELKDISDDKKRWEKAYQYLINNKNIRVNNLPRGITIDILHEYQNAWYQEKNMIFVSNDGLIDTTF
ncbi:hypothetical protein FACS1894176_05590 [Bacteroidia bacterium]|nr:hypothetical protein FACS189428_3350 [Clostridia bacterium]GHV25921.1 hypothetical protein FACS1894176_05590 [Bacteroidia bacterium]